MGHEQSLVLMNLKFAFSVSIVPWLLEGIHGGGLYKRLEYYKLLGLYLIVIG